MFRKKNSNSCDLAQVKIYKLDMQIRHTFDKQIRHANSTNRLEMQIRHINSTLKFDMQTQ